MSHLTPEDKAESQALANLVAIGGGIVQLLELMIASGAVPLSIQSASQQAIREYRSACVAYRKASDDREFKTLAKNRAAMARRNSQTRA